MSAHDEPPLTRRELRERERRAEAERSAAAEPGGVTEPTTSTESAPQQTAGTGRRRVTTSEPIRGGEIPTVDASVPEPGVAEPRVPEPEIPDAAGSETQAPAAEAPAPVAPESQAPETVVPGTRSPETAGTESLFTRSPAERVPERTMTRRELRELLAREAAEGTSPPETPEPDGAATPASSASDFVQPLAPPEQVAGSAAPPGDSSPSAAIADESPSAATAGEQDAAASEAPDARTSPAEAPAAPPEKRGLFGRRKRAESAASEPTAPELAAREQAAPEPAAPGPDGAPARETSAPPALSDEATEVIAEAVAPPADPSTPAADVVPEPPSPTAGDRDDASPETAPESDPAAAPPLEPVLFSPPTAPIDDRPGAAFGMTPDNSRPASPGHWASTEGQAFDQIVSRGSGTAATGATNALILPALPVSDATGPLLSTGDVLVTGSIDLPRSVGSTGAHPRRYDSADIDRLLDEPDEPIATSELAPVRASRAVSSHTSTRGVMAPPKARGNRLPIVLAITAGVLALAVIGLIVAGYVFRVI